MKKEELIAEIPIVIAGPCSISSRDQILRAADEIAESGATGIKTMLWKPRTKPDSFQGVGNEGLPWLREVKEKTGLPIVTEVMSEENVKDVRGVADVLWVGARNMQNFSLLKALKEEEQVVILKRGLIANMKEWVGAAEYIGTDRVILCERGIRTGADAMRFTLDFNAMLVAKHDHGFPVIIDPSHSAGRRDMVEHLALAAVAAGADGLVIEAHYDPEEELVDRDQTIDIPTLTGIVGKTGKIFQALSIS